MKPLILTRHHAFLIMWSSFILWKLWSCDWVVKCRYSYTDTDPPVSVSYGVETFHPPSAPIWDPPTPERISGQAGAKWTDWDFFPGGGSWGPLETPHLHINWSLWLGKIVSVGMLLYLVVFCVAEATARPCEGVAV